MSAGDTNYPGGIDAPYGVESDYFAGQFNNIDGAGTDFSRWMHRQDSGMQAMQTYGASVLGSALGALISNSSAEASILASTIPVPAGRLRAGSILEVRAFGSLFVNSGTGTTVTFKVKLGSTSLLNIPALPTGGTTWTLSANPHLFELYLTIAAATVGTSGALETYGRIAISQATTSDMDSPTGSQFQLVGGAASTVNTTVSQAFDLRATLSTANAGDSIAAGWCSVTHIPKIG